MRTTSHTTGPWSAYRVGEGHTLAYHIESVGKRLIARVAMTHEQAEADAQLIAAAPDLLAVLRGDQSSEENSPLHVLDAILAYYRRETKKAADRRGEDVPLGVIRGITRMDRFLTDARAVLARSETRPA